jgi:DNA polymerase III subunit delta'
MHHAWLISGPKGVGKATLAWKIARFLLAEAPADAGLFGAPPPPATLDLPHDHPIVRRTTALSESRLCLVRRGWDEKAKRLKSEITVDEARRLKSFLSLSAADGGRRVILVDAVDEMNTNAANALLKILEEPPARTTLLLVSHQPARLLPTIRSRCRDLRCATLAPERSRWRWLAPGSKRPPTVRLLPNCRAARPGRRWNSSRWTGFRPMRRSWRSSPARPRWTARARSACRRGCARTTRARPFSSVSSRPCSPACRPRARATARREAAPGEARMLARLAPSLPAAHAWAELHERWARARATALPSTLTPPRSSSIWS